MSYALFLTHKKGAIMEKKVTVSVMMPADELRLLRVITSKKDVSISSYIRKATRDALEVEEK
jgi:hypothetical protein